MLPDLTPLERLQGNYAFYFRQAGLPPVLRANHDRFRSASLIKLPILLAWIWLERRGDLSRDELCDLDAEPQVHGAGFSWLFTTRRLTYHDVLLMMLATSDNLCTNLIIRRVGMEFLNQIFTQELGLAGTLCQRRLMDFAARERGLDNWITAGDAVRLFDLFHALPPGEKTWVEPMLLVNQDDTLFKRELPSDKVKFYHKTGSLSGLSHDWGYTRTCDLFLLVQDTPDELETAHIFGELGRVLLQ